LSSLTALTYLSFSDNQLTGSIPLSLAALTMLTTLDLRNNELFGEFPSSLCKVPDISIYIDCGAITNVPEDCVTCSSTSIVLPDRGSSMTPEEIGCYFLQMTNLDVCRARFSFDTIKQGGRDTPTADRIPTEIGLVTALQYLDLSVSSSFSRAGLVGSIPSTISNLTQLAYLSLQYNELSGSIPSTWTALSLLTTLSFADNQLTGSIPSSLSSLTALTYLSFSDNQLTGSIPLSLAALTMLTTLDLRNKNENVN
jgi:Leucine-rich repeat (LRR) protein